ncbi:hypothetical protein [Selenomonas sp. oral taxon 892]|jgi:hypothetical protein|uniref:hypothetical protein n=1 Tax=Selenomonas sp. oral taxon 892 TaxID=1321785 RepID=UPI0003ACE942|nr:hypothetical protein [Selenomonas sp. oral taxon 892]ERJ95914.1 hypothetical protein HMPREF1992_00192 [Selenomonas sp. oral taxon 892 str. F0426]
MQNFFRRLIILVAMLLILIGIFGLSYTYQIDHRTARSLSAYARIDFQASYTGEGRLEGATLSLWDYRFDEAKFLPNVVLYTDGSAWEMKAATKYTPRPVEGADSPYKNENKFFVELPRSSLPAIRKATSIRIRFYYDNGQTIDLPLNEPDLAYWQRELGRGI